MDGHAWLAVLDVLSSLARSLVAFAADSHSLLPQSHNVARTGTITLKAANMAKHNSHALRSSLLQGARGSRCCAMP